MAGIAKTRWLTTDEQRTWRTFIAGVHTLLSAVEGQLQRDSAIPFGYYEILVRLSEAEGRSLRMSQLAEASTSSKSRLSHAVARLEERGWVERLDCETDRRGQFARLTDEGFAALAAAAPSHVEQVRRSLFDRITPEQARQLYAIMMVIGAGTPDADGADGCALACDTDASDSQTSDTEASDTEASDTEASDTGAARAGDAERGRAEA